MTTIAKGTKVLLKTTNGGESVCHLGETYRPTYCAVFYFNGRPENYTLINAGRIASVTPIE